MKNNITTCIVIAILLMAFPEISFGQLLGGATPSFKYAPADKLHVIKLPAINTDSLLADDAINEQYKGRPYRFGYNHLVYYKPENSGTWTNLPNGDRVWQLDVKTPGSFTINLGFTDFHLPAGAKLFIHPKDQSQIFSYTSANNTPDNFYGTDLIKGDEAILEYYEPAAVKGQSSFTLFRVTQGYKNIGNYLKSGIGFGTSGTCINNVNCPQYYDYATQKRSVVCIVIGGNEFCSGSLINNVLSDGTPYILTANHCVTGTVDGTWVFRFNWEAPGCAEPQSDPTYEIITGASLIAKSGVSDFALLKMDTTPPPSYHAFYAGWNRGLAAATSVTDIHHPNADIKKCSKADNAVTDTFYDAGNGIALVWQIGQWTDGATEPGSSGSPLYDQNKRIVGQLYGGPSDCGEAADQLRDYFGRFPVSWDSGSTPQTRLKDWLDPNSTDTVTNDGYDPYPVSNPLNIAALNIFSPTGAFCADSVSPVVSVENGGTDTITSFIVTYSINNGTTDTFAWTGSLAYLDSTIVHLPSIACSTGSNNLMVSVTSPNDSANIILYNGSLSSAFITFSSTGQNAPLAQGFEGNVFPPTNWSITTPPSGTTWQQTTPGGFSESQYSAFVNEFSPANSNAGEIASLFTPPVNMTNAPNPSFIKFDVAYRPYDALNTDSLAVLVSVDCGVTWSKIYQKGGETLATDTYSDTLFIPAPNEWRKDSVDISNLVGKAEVLFQFEAISGYGNAMYVDNIDIADSSITLGVSPVTDNISIHVFPNPSSQSFNLQFSLDATQNITAGVYSIDGKKLIPVMDNERADAGAHNILINAGSLSNGIYILKVNEHFFKLEKLK